MNRMNPRSRIVVATGSLIMLVAYMVPVWSIYLIAPQYPEGLSMQIWLNKITGQVDIINGLNHYIGMKQIEVAMFPEFTYLVYVVAFFILFGLTIAITGSRKLLLVYLVLSAAGGAAALIDFYKWGYDYGHNLNPAAAIQVPGLSYQPPLIGHKKLLNFDSYSYPDTGAWIIMVATAVLFVVWLVEWRKSRKQQQNAASRKAGAATVAAMSLFITACNPHPEKIESGKDSCSECRMTIMDPRFGAEIVTKKGKVFKFDDVHCVASFLNRRGVELDNIHQTLFADYDTKQFVNVSSAEFVVSSQFKSPMGGNAAAFASMEAAQRKAAELEGSKVTNWATLYNVLVK